MPSAHDDQVRLIANPRSAIGETPVWQGGKVTWPAPLEHCLHRIDPTAPGAGDMQSRVIDRAVFALALNPEGRMFGTLENGFAEIAEDGTLIAGPAAPLTAGCRFNDMAIDPRGRLWAGSMHRGVLASRGGLWFASDLASQPRCVAEGIGVANGMDFAPDGTRLFVVDTLTRTLLAYPVGADGELGEPSIVADFLDLPGKPDGMTLAADGSFWVAMWGGGCVVQLAPDGAVLRSIALPAPHVSSLCFAGEDRLLVTTSRARLAPATLDRYPDSGGLFAIDLAPPAARQVQS